MHKLDKYPNTNDVFGSNSLLNSIENKIPLNVLTQPTKRKSKNCFEKKMLISCFNLSVIDNVLLKSAM